MTSDGFAAAAWVDRIAQALAQLDRVQGHYADELWAHRLQMEHAAVSNPWSSHSRDPWIELCHLYSTARSREHGGFAEHYRPLCAELAVVRTTLITHPALAGVVDPSDPEGEFRCRLANGGGLGSLPSVIGGLMARAKQAPGGGFRLAASELDTLLRPVEAGEGAAGSVDLNVGYHVVLFHGLGVGENVPIADNMRIRPYEQCSAYLDENVLQDIAPEIIRYNRRKEVAAIVKPFRWKPLFRARGEDTEPKPELDWGGNFFEEAQAFVELLAMSHAAPVVCLATVSYCIHRTASCLLGMLHGHGGYGWGRSARSLDRLARSIEVSADAVDDAKGAFLGRNRDRYRDYAPVIAQLAEALARSGRFRIDDRILDVAMALERIYELDRDEISFKLKTRAACLLETGKDGRLRVFRDVGKLYDVRSAIIHKRKKQPSAEQKETVFNRGFDVARRSVVKLLRDGAPPDWNEVVLAGPGPTA